MFLLGVDCATKAKETGLAFGHLDDEKLVITHAEPDSERRKNWTMCDIENTVVKWITGVDNCLLAIDAPLGWPKSLSKSLRRHKAGRAFSIPADHMFDRETDRWIHQHINKSSGNRPLSVGADKIARTAHSALSFLMRLRNESACAIPLSWKPGYVNGVSAIEVYPAATLKGRGVLSNETEDVIEKLKEEETTMSDDIEKQMRANKHIRDAVVCVLAAADFVKGDATPPENMKRAKKEGWIWVKKPDEQAEASSAESKATDMSIHKTPGNRNRNDQITIRETPWPGNDHNATICILECEKCEFRYGANGSDIWERRCPNCQDGRPCSRPECPAVADGDIGNCRECRA